jgi:hypothetical protein
VKEKMLKATGHKHTSEVTAEPTCTKEGTRVYTCSKCNDSYTEKIEKLPHTEESSVTKKASCTEEGVLTKTCSVCGQVETEAIALLPHSFVSKTTKAATCTEKGSKQSTCSVCGTKQDATPIPALGHDHVRKVTKEPTCAADGSALFTCSRCGDSYTEAIAALGHTWTEATCTEPSVCSRCNEHHSAALGHTTSTGVCSRCKYNFTKPISFSGEGKGQQRTTHSISYLPYGKYRMVVTVNELGTDSYHWEVGVSKDSYGNRAGYGYGFDTGTFTFDFTSEVSGGFAWAKISGPYEITIKPIN